MAPPLAHRILGELEQAYQTDRLRDAVADPDFHIVWKFHAERRLGDRVYPLVFTVRCFELAPQHQRQGVLTGFARLILESDRAPLIPMRHLHFQDCNSLVGGVLRKMHFRRYLIGNSVDWWRPVTGQKELL